MGRTGSFIRVIGLLIFLYFFLVSIKLLGHGFKVFGTGYAAEIIQATANPLVAVSIGLLATTLMQSSSTTTSIIVGLVAGGVLTVDVAIFMVMGANIGTSVTNTLVSLGHVLRRVEFRRAFAGSTVHDFFNFFAVLVLLPIEYFFHPISIGAAFLANAFSGMGGFEFISPLKVVVSPAVEAISTTLGESTLLIVGFSLVLLFLSLFLIVKTMKSLVLNRVENFLDTFLFRTAFMAFILGALLTAIVQSSSVTTSLIVPLLGAGILTLRKIFPYTLGTNIGTTITAIMASLVTGSVAALTVAFGHLLFNIFGIALLYPFRELPIRAAERMGEIAYRSRRLALLYIVIAFLLIPLAIVIIFDWHIIVSVLG